MKEGSVSVGLFATGRSLGRLICFGLAAWIASGSGPNAMAQGPPPARVKVELVRKLELPTTQTFVGSVEPVQSSTVASQVEGLVISLSAREGARVEKGDVLAELRSEQAQIQLAAARAELQLCQKEQEELRKVLPLQIAEAKARRDAAKALEQFARLRLKRAQQLAARNAISEDDLEARQSVAVAAVHKLTESQAAWSALALSEQEKYAEADARVAAQQKEVDRLADDLEQHKILAPFRGAVTVEHTEHGQWLTVGAPVVELVRVDQLDVEVAVPEQYISQLEVGVTQARVTVAAMPGHSWPAPVHAIVLRADPRSRCFPVKVRLGNLPESTGVLPKPGMFARVTLPTGGRGPSLVISKDAVVPGGRLPVVYVVDPLPKGQGVPGGAPQNGTPAGPPPDGTARQVAVELVPSVEDLVVVRGPLKPGDRVVVEGNERLFPGRPVIVVNPQRPSKKTPDPKPAP